MAGEKRSTKTSTHQNRNCKIVKEIKTFFLGGGGSFCCNSVLVKYHIFKNIVNFFQVYTLFVCTILSCCECLILWNRSVLRLNRDDNSQLSLGRSFLGKKWRVWAVGDRSYMNKGFLWVYRVFFYFFFFLNRSKTDGRMMLKVENYRVKKNK